MKPQLDPAALYGMYVKGYSTSEIARQLGLSRNTVKSSIYRYQKRLKSQTGETPAPTAEYWKQRVMSLERQLRDAQYVEDGVKMWQNLAKQLAPISYRPPDKIWQFKPQKEKTAQTLVVLLGDTHVGQVVSPKQTLFYGGYDFDVFCRRLAHLERSVRSLLIDYPQGNVVGCTVVMLGDMMHGGLKHNDEISQINTLFSQFFSAGHALAQFLRGISSIVPVKVYTTVGNHTRWFSQAKMPVRHRYSNLDQFLYAYVQALLRDIPRIQIELSEQPVTQFYVFDWLFHAVHGDQLLGGDYQFGIPWHSLSRHVQAQVQWALKSRSRPPDYLIFGHLHRPMILHTGHCECIFNGGFPGLDEYGISRGHTNVPPSQVCFFVHPKYGRTATYTIGLHYGDSEAAPYSFPSEFICQ